MHELSFRARPKNGPTILSLVGMVADAHDVRDRIVSLLETNLETIVPPLDDDAMDEMKFMPCVPPGLVSKLVDGRFSCRKAWQTLRGQRIVVVRR